MKNPQLDLVRKRIKEVCRSVGRDPASVTLLAVSKQQPAFSIEEAYADNQLDFGENYAQELAEKSELLSMSCPQMRWHFLGPLQRNKVRYVVGTALLIHSVDRESLLLSIAEEVKKKNLNTQDCLIQVNIGNEMQKSGCSEDELPKLLDLFASLEGRVRCLGLMCIPPIAIDPEDARSSFRKLVALRTKMQSKERRCVDLKELSMGMSQDYEVAIEEGATIVRIGTSIFGARRYTT